MTITKRILTGALAGVMTAALLLTGCEEKQPEIASENWYDYDLAEYVTLPAYKGIEVDAYLPTDVDAVVEQQVMLARSNYATVAEKKGAVVNGDQVNIDYAGYMDGVQFESGTAVGADLTIGSGRFIEGFEEGLIGAKTGDTVTLDIRFPDPYPNNMDLSGKPVKFVVTVNAVYEQVLPEYNDAFVQEYYGKETVEAFETDLRAAIIEQNERNRYNFVAQAVWEYLAAETKVISYPEAEYDVLYQQSLAHYTAEADEKGVTLNEHVADAYGLSVEEFYAALESNIKESMLQEMILYTIARQENITVSDEMYAERAAGYAAYYGYPSLEEFEKEYGKEYIRDSILFNIVDEFLVENAVEIEAAE